MRITATSSKAKEPRATNFECLREMRVVNASPIGAFKELWTPAVNLHDYITGFLKEFTCVRYEHMKIGTTAANTRWDEAELKFQRFRDMIGEITIVRSWVRPLNAKTENRKAIVEKAQETVKALEVTGLPPGVVMVNSLFLFGEQS